MSLRTLLLLAALVGIGWWYSPVSPRVTPVAALAPGQPPGCPLPPRVSPGDAPLQTPVPDALRRPFQLQAGNLTPLAGFSIDARVLSREDYRSGREAQFSPTDLALGWQRMREDTVLSRLKITQSGRWYRYEWGRDQPLPAAEIARSSANMHMIPSDAATAAALKAVNAGDHVRIDGWLVQVDTPDDWHWRSSTTRDDTGAGACEIVYVCAIATR